MEILLHIGMPKTGSTTIQRTLLTNKSRLSHAGIYYPYRSQFLYGLVTGTETGPALRIPKRCQRMIISDERLFNRVRSAEDAQKIVDTLREITTNIKLFSYVRREDEVFVSAYFTRLLMGHSDKLTDLPLNPVQIHKRLRSWNKPLDRRNMIVRRFGRPYLEGGLIPDFTEAIGIGEVQLEEAPLANSSPRCDVLEIIRLLNARRGAGEVNRFALKAVARAVGFGDRIGMSAEKRMVLIEKSAELNAKLSKTYFGGQEVFSHPVPDDEPNWPDIGVEHLARVADRMGDQYGTALGRPPAALDEALDWMAEIAERCAAKPRREPEEPIEDTEQLSVA